MPMDELLLEYENAFFSYAFCHDKTAADRRIHDDFLEYGTSGRIYGKAETLRYLTSLPGDRRIVINDFHCESICHDAMIVHYISINADSNSAQLRSSIWKKEGEDWKLYFHQGTATKPNDTL